MNKNVYEAAVKLWVDNYESINKPHPIFHEQFRLIKTNMDMTERLVRFEMCKQVNYSLADEVYKFEYDETLVKDEVARLNSLERFDAQDELVWIIANQLGWSMIDKEVHKGA